MTSADAGNGDQPRKSSDFSIEHILTRAGTSGNCDRVEARGNLEDFGNFDGGAIPFPWLNCTRYCPPKVPRKKEGPQKRQLGRHPRIPFTTQQLAILEERFKQSPYLSSEEVTKLSKILQLADIRVKIWFQNRRARERRERQQPPDSPKSSSSPEPGPSIPSTSQQTHFSLQEHPSAYLHQPNLVFDYLLNNSRR